MSLHGSGIKFQYNEHTAASAKEKLSPVAFRLAEKVGDGSVAEALKADPSLAEGLDEYQHWRDEEQLQHGQEIGGRSQKRPVAHESSRLLKRLSVKSKTTRQKK